MPQKNITVNEFECPGCREKLTIGTKKCKWCGTYIANAHEKVSNEPPKKKSWFKK